MAFVPFTKDEQPTMAAFNEKFQQAIEQALADGVKIEVGSYVGTGTYTSGNPNKITFGFVPKLVIVHPNAAFNNQQYTLIWVYNNGYATNTYYVANTNNNPATYVICSLSGTTLSWYTGYSIDAQLNKAGTTYSYIAIG